MINSFYPIIMSTDIKKGSEFFKKYFDFKETFVGDWYISLKHESNYEIAFIDKNHEAIPIPENFRYQSKGIVLNFEVDNVDEIYKIIQNDKNTNILLEIKNEDFGQRHFMLEAPDNLLIDVFQIIPPTEEFLKQYIVEQK